MNTSLWAWKDELGRNGSAQTWGTTTPNRGHHDAILAENPKANAVAMRWDAARAEAESWRRLVAILAPQGDVTQ